METVKRGDGMKTLVCYTSLSGFTQSYAEWIAESLQADILPLKMVKAEKFSQYDLIIYGGSLHAVGINGVKYIKNQLSTLKATRIVIFAVGASPVKEGINEEILNGNFTKEEQDQITLFYLRGGFDYTRLNLYNKMLMALLKLKISLKKSRNSDERGMLAAFDKPLIEVLSKLLILKERPIVRSF